MQLSPTDIELAKLAFGREAVDAAIAEADPKASASPLPLALSAILGVVGCLVLVAVAVAVAVYVAHRRGGAMLSCWPVGVTASLVTLALGIVIAALSAGLVR